MDETAEDMDTARREMDAPQPDNMLQEADWLNEEGLGYHLNLMASLYYEVTDDEGSGGMENEELRMENEE